MFGVRWCVGNYFDCWVSRFAWETTRRVEEGRFRLGGSCVLLALSVAGARVSHRACFHSPLIEPRAESGAWPLCEASCDC